VVPVSARNERTILTAEAFSSKHCQNAFQANPGQYAQSGSRPDRAPAAAAH
jgi:hypothetical protein